MHSDHHKQTISHLYCCRVRQITGISNEQNSIHCDSPQKTSMKVLLSVLTSNCTIMLLLKQGCATTKFSWDQEIKTGLKCSLIIIIFKMIKIQRKTLPFNYEDICKLTQLHTHTVLRQLCLGQPQRTSRACLRRDRGASEAAWQIWVWPPWRERERPTGFISLFLIPLTRSTGSTVVLCAGFMYSQEENKKITGPCMSGKTSISVFFFQWHRRKGLLMSRSCIFLYEKRQLCHNNWLALCVILAYYSGCHFFLPLQFSAWHWILSLCIGYFTQTICM